MQSGGAAIGAPSISLSPPSFNAYSSSDSLAQIAARVVSELHDELDQAGLDDIDDVYHQNDDDVTDLNDEEEEFEFACVSRDAASTIAAEEAFYDGQIRPVYPVFDQSLLLPNEDDDVAAVDKHSEKSAGAEAEARPRRRPLGILMSEEVRGGGETASCSSSSEADDLESLPAGTYCVWAPGKAADSRITNSEKGGRMNSGGGGSSSRRWRFRDLLYRSSSEGSTKGSLVFSAAKKAEGEKEGGNVVVVRKVGSEAADEDKRRSFLPYKQDVVGFFSNVNGLGRNLHPF